MPTLPASTLRKLALIAFVPLMCAFAICQSVSEPSQGKSSLTEQGRDLLFRSIRGDFRANIVAIVKQGDLEDDDEVTKVKVVRSASGKSRNAIIAPLRRQGNETVNDGEKIYTFVTDEKTMIVEPASNFREEADFRVPLIQKNYIISAKRGPQIAGRTTISVTAMAREARIGGTRYVLDTKTAYVMRKEIYNSEDEEWTPNYEVIQAEFPATLESSIFKIKPIGGYDTIEYGAKTNIASMRDAEKLLGFQPVMPKEIPYGFAIQSIQTNTKSAWKSLSVRLTDGIQRITVYQWKPSGTNRIKTGSGMSVTTVNGISTLVVSDLDSGVRSSVLKSFSKVAANATIATLIDSTR